MRGLLRRPITKGAAGLVLLFLAACGPVPHPFEHEAANPLVEDRRALSTISVQPVGGLVGLDEAIIKAFEDEDVPAASHPPAPGGLWLRGTWLAGKGVSWVLQDPKGTTVGEIVIPVPSGPFNDLARLQTAKASAKALAHILRGEDPKASDEEIDQRPRIALPPLKAPKDFDAEGLRRDAIIALLREGYVVSDAKGLPVVLCNIHITPPPAGMTNGQDLLELSWVVQSPDGKELGKVDQGNSVDPLLLTGYIGPLGRAIANSAAPGIVEVLRKQSATPQKTSP